MRKHRFALLVAFALALISTTAAAIGPVLLAHVQAAAGATTSAVNAHNPNIRGQDGKLTAQRLSTDPQGCEIYISDATGETFTGPSTATVIKSATLSLVSATRGSAVSDGPNGTCKLTKPGLYAVSVHASGTGANTATITINAFRNDAGGGAAVLAPSIEGVATTLTANPTFSLSPSGTIVVTAAQAVATGGVVIDGRITASTGNPVVKQYRLRVWKIDELDPASP